MRQTATLSGDKVDWPMPTFAAPAVPKIAGTRKMWGSARLPKGHELGTERHLGPAGRWWELGTELHHGPTGQRFASTYKNARHYDGRSGEADRKKVKKFTDADRCQQLSQEASSI